MKITAFSFTKTLSKVAILLLAGSAAHALEGGDHSGGGNGCLLKLTAVSEDVQSAVDQLQSVQAAGIDASEFKKTLAATRFEIGENLTKSGAPVDALNFPDQTLVMVDKSTCSAALSTLSDAMSLLVHETLGLMKKDDSDYRISKNVLNELTKIIVTKPESQWNYVCAVKRYHYSSDWLQRIGIKPSGVGFEILALLTVGHFKEGYYGPYYSGFLYGRSDHETDDYSVAIDISRGPWDEREPALLYSFERDPHQDSSKVQYLTKTGEPWEEVKFDDYGRATIHLLNGDAFTDGNSFMDLECYRSK